MPLMMTADEVMTVLDRVFGQVAGQFAIEELREMQITVRLKVGEQHLRPGGTVSGPSIFGLADVAIYMIVMAMIGPKVLAVTTSSSMDFMRKPDGQKDLIATCKLLKLGRSLAVGDVLIFSEGGQDPVARASMTYSIPPER
ncbi:MAG: PaaI family thioesterase [Pseudomonadota bacterium]